MDVDEDRSTQPAKSPMATTDEASLTLTPTLTLTLFSRAEVPWDVDEDRGTQPTQKSNGNNGWKRRAPGVAPAAEAAAAAAAAERGELPPVSSPTLAAPAWPWLMAPRALMGLGSAMWCCMRMACLLSALSAASRSAVSFFTSSRASSNSAWGHVVNVVRRTPRGVGQARGDSTRGLRLRLGCCDQIRVDSRSPCFR